MAALSVFVAASIPAAFAHNLGQDATFIAFDPPTLANFSARAASSQPLVKNGDVLGVVLKTTPGPGTATGAGGYMTFYIPPNTQVVGVEYVREDPNAPGTLVPVPINGPAIMPLGAGPIGATCPVLAGNRDLRSVTLGPNVLGVADKPVSSTYCHRGTLAGVYNDTGMFYSTDPSTAYGSWVGGAMVNNRGNTTTPTNNWDAWQFLAYGVKSPSLPILDPTDGRGNAPWGLASAVAGPQSGYAWEFNKPLYDASQPPATYLKVGPWQRIQYPGSQISHDQAGSTSTALGYAGTDANFVGGAAAGVVVSAANPLPSNVNAVRIAHGLLELGRTEMVRLKLKVLADPAPNVAPYDAQGCFVIQGEAFGGDAGGEDGGKDHLWRYFLPTVRTLNPCKSLQKVGTLSVVKPGGQVTYRIDFVNLGSTPLTNVVVSDTLPAGLTFVSASPAQTSGPNPLTWSVGTVAAGSISTFYVTVNTPSSGTFTNTVAVTSNGTPIDVTKDTTVVQSLALLRYGKTVTPSAVAPGGSVQYTLTVTNDGTGPQGLPLVINELLPPGFSYTSLVSAEANGAPLPGAAVSVNAANANRPVFSVNAGIQGGNQLKLVFNVAVAPGTPNGTYENVVQLVYDGKVIGGLPTAPVVVGTASIGDTVYRDWNNNGAQDPTDEGIAGATVQLYAGSCPAAGGVLQTTSTDSNGHYLFNVGSAGTYCVVVSGTPVSGYTGPTQRSVTVATGQSSLDIDFPLVPGGSGVIGDKVFDDVNRSGLFDAGDAGIPGVTVRLYEDTNGDGVIGAADALVATTTTNGSGDYSFTGLATGLKYIVQVDPADAALTTYFGGGVAYGVTTPMRQSSDLGAATSDTARDFGFARPGAIGDQVYVDANGNGVFDAGEQGLPNITVTLTYDANTNGVADPGETQVTVTTDAAGKYLFGNLPPGYYVVAVDTTDPDVPGTMAAVGTPTRAIVLSTGELRLDADFPFAEVLKKTVSPTSATPGATLDYTLRPNWPGPALLTNATVVDPIPANATYVASSANAGGVFDNVTIPNQVVWALGSNAAAIPGVIPSAGLAYCPAPAQTTTLTVDTYIRQGQATSNFGTNTNLVTRPGGSDRKHILMGVDLSGLPPGAVIQSATFKLRSENSRNNHYVEIHRLLTSFTEAGATWNTRDGSTAWAGSGAFSASDYDPTAVAVVKPVGGNKFVTGDITSLVKQWYASPATNKGMVLLATGTDSGDANWSSSDDTTAANRPSLTIRYVLQQSGSPGAVACEGAVGGDVLTADFDTFVDSNAPTATNATAAQIRSQESTNKKRPLIHFDLGGIPQGATVSTATLSVYPDAGSVPHTDEVRRMLTRWAEAANWNTRDGVAAWGGGSTFSSSDYSATNSATVSVAATGTAIGVSVTSLVDGWINGGLPNNGVALVPTGADANELRYGSRDNGTAGKRPTLTVQWQQLFSSQTGTTVSLSAAPLLLTAPGAITVRMTVGVSGNVNGVTPPGSLTVTASGLGSVSCGAPSPAGPVNLTAATTATFTYSCSVTAGTLPGSVTFAGKPTASGGVSFAGATSEEVLVTPPLTFQATVNPGATVVVSNVATLSDDGTVSANATADTNLGAGIAGKVYVDANGNGTLDGGETGVGGVEVCATNGVVVCTTTSPDGTYMISGLSAGNWTVAETLATFPPGTVPTSPTSLNVTLAALEQKTGINFGLQPWQNDQNPAAIGDTVWVDANGNGTVDPGETLLAGVTVNLYVDVNNNSQLDIGTDILVATTTTDATGNYQFGNLNADRYLVQVDTSTGGISAAGYGVVSLSDVPAAGSPPAVIAVNLGSGATVSTADFGFGYTGSIGDQLYYDNNRSGSFDGGDATVPAGVPVVLYQDVDGDGALTIGIDVAIAVTATDASGLYAFTHLPPGKYLVKADEQQVPHPISSAVGTMVPTTGDLVAVTLANGQVLTTVDFGFAEGGLIEGTVFYDQNVNALFDAGDSGLSGITVTATGGSCSPCTTATDANGEFQFLLPPGTYTITYTYPGGGPLTQTTTPTSYVVNLAAGQEVTGVDFGRILPGTLGDTVYADLDSNGSQGPGEPGLAGVLVELYQSNVLVAFTTTDAQGHYLFRNLADGTYEVRVSTQAGSLPPGYATTPTGDPDATKDGRGTATLSGGSQNLGLDFGYPPAGVTYSVSGNVWYDNGAGGGTATNGVRDGGESGLGSVRLNVAVDVDGDTVADLNYVVTTDSNGDYVVTGIPAGANVSITVDPTSLPASAYQTGDPDEAGRCTVCNGATAIAGIAANATNRNFGYATVIAAPITQVNISGQVWDDGNGDGTKSGESGTNAGGLNVVLTDNSGVVLAVTAVAAGGTYSFTAVAASTAVKLVLTTANPAVSSTYAPGTPPLPSNWTNTTTQTLSFNTGTVDVTGKDFGIEQLPVAVAGSVASQLNPGGTSTVTVPASAFTGSTDADGTVTSYRITSFPTNATSITLNGTSYTSGTFPGGGVTVPVANIGAVLVDPVDGTVTVGIPFRAIDNAGRESANTATVNLPFTVAPQAQADVSIVKTGPPIADAGSAIVYRLVVGNAGPDGADGTVVRDPAVANFTVTGVTCTSATGGAACPVVVDVATLQSGGLTIPTFPSGGAVTFDVTGTVGQKGRITNVATATPPQAVTDPDVSNNSSAAHTTAARTIPAVSTAMLVLLMLMLAGLAVFAIRRRN